MRRLIIKNSYGLEVWQDIPQYEGKYQASTLGKIKSLNYRRTGKEGILKLHLDGDGYPIVNLHPTKTVHFLVAKTWLPSRRLDQIEVNHKDEDKTNNRVENLEWCSREYNIKYGTRNQRSAEANKNHPNMSKPILQYDKQGNLITEYPSAHEAARQTGVNCGNISSCCNGNKNYSHAGGYIWKYKN